jgi:regulator of nucleoside diphosphate kinase
MKPLMLAQADFANLSLLEHGPLQRLLERATVVSSDSMPPEVITMNTLARLSADTGELRLVRVVYPADADAAQGHISVIDPLGTALLAACVGETIELPVADGTCRLRVEEIMFQPQQSLRYGLVVNDRES